MGCSTMFQPLQWGHGDTDQVLQSGHRRCGRSEFWMLCLRFHRYVWESLLSLCGKFEVSWGSSFKGRAKMIAGILYKQEWDDLSHLTNIEEVGELFYKRLKLLYKKEIIKCEVFVRDEVFKWLYLLVLCWYLIFLSFRSAGWLQRVSILQLFCSSLFTPGVRTPGKCSSGKEP